MKPILYWNRRKSQIETERVFGEQFVRFTYGTPPGRFLTNSLLVRASFSQAYGVYQSSTLSRHKIEPFIRDYEINMSEFEDPGFQSFNDFFIRRFKPGARQFCESPRELPAFAEARYFAFDRITDSQTFPVKGFSLSARGLLGSENDAAPFIGGPVLLARLCPTDYHRFHYPDDGETTREYRLHGHLHSVNPFAIANKPDIFITNERHVSILETVNFGKLAYVEVGALCVGKIVQTHPVTKPFKRGDEKGYFLFGGSTVIVLGEPGRWKPDSDLLEQTAQGRETLIELGARVGSFTSR